MDMAEVKDMNMMEEHDHLMNHRLGEEGMNMMEEHYHPMSHQLKVEEMDMVDIHMVEVEGMDMVEELPLNHRPEMEGMDGEDNDMREDMTVEVEVVEREHEGVVLAKLWTDDRAERHRSARQEWEELMKSRCPEGHTPFASRDSIYSAWCIV
jgi:hypothetical protein